MYKTLLVTIVAVALLGLIPTTTAQDHVGLSGQCYNADASEGGEDEARVYTNGDVVLLPGTTGDSDPTDSKGGAVPALVLFATESVNDGGQTGNACKRDDCYEGDQPACTEDNDRFDYLEVSFAVGAFQFQVCYNSGVVFEGCPTSPTGEGST